MKKKINKFFKKIKIKIPSKKSTVYFSLVIFLVLVLYFGRSLIFAAWAGKRPIFRTTVIGELEKQAGEQVLGNLINKSLIEQEARSKNIKITDAQVKSELGKIEESLKGQGMSLDTALSSQKMTQSDLQAQIKTQLAVEEMLKDKISSSDGTIDREKLFSEYQKLISELQAKAKVLYFVKY